jgi:MYXO-CTERM domain-containing protein
MRLPALLSLASLLLLRPAPAHACGGTFCDVGPQSMPVDQTGENILFILEPGQVEVHIQIQVDPNTNANKFAWLIPMPEVPDFSIGSELFFQELLNATVPTYGINDSFESCSLPTTTDSPTSGIGTTDPTTTSDPSGGGVDVLKQEIVGAFEIVVLAGMSAPDIMQWLTDNAYQAIPGAEPILQQYLDEGNKVVAFKLARGEELESVHPVVLRYPGPDGCVPIRLTRIAAVDDMDIRVFALADGRAIPTNYRHVLVNPLKIDWFNFAANYKEVVSMAVDAFMAEGHAFVTEYAGNSNIINQFSFYSTGWFAPMFDGLAPTSVINQLNNQGLASCYDSFSCVFNHPLIEGLLATHLPVPQGLGAAEFYACLDCFVDQIDLAAWNNGAGFAADLQERVIDPARHARDLVQAWPYLSRLYTTISPNEMTDDPLFQINPDLGDVPNLRIATRMNLCDTATVLVTLPDGREVYAENSATWPAFPEAMPWEEEVEQIALVGQPQPLVDNTQTIDRLLAEWNAAHKPLEASTGTGTGTDTATGTAGEIDGAGCGCRSTQSPAALALLALLLRRRRRACL